MMEEAEFSLVLADAREPKAYLYTETGPSATTANANRTSTDGFYVICFSSFMLFLRRMVPWSELCNAQLTYADYE
jgi:hypothetical protein